jgi:transposase-like protein
MQRFVRVEALFKGRHSDGQIIILCVSWYTSFKLSLRDLVIMMADRGIPLTHTTIPRWVQHYLPEFEKRWSRYGRPVGGSWRMDETYIKVRGSSAYLYRSVDKDRRFLPELQSRCDRWQDLSPQCDEEPAHTHQDHTRRAHPPRSH